MFKIQEDSFGSLTQLELSNVLTGEYVTIIHDYGTAVNDLALKANGKIHNILRGTHDCHDMVGKKWFKSAKLSPFPNRVRDGQYTFNKKKYKLPITEEARNNALHGFIYNRPFDLVGHSEGQYEASVEFQYTYNGKVEGYPFPYKIDIEYIFSEDGLEVVTTLKNTGTTPMPIGDGWHPYFKTGLTVNDLQLCLPKGKLIEVDERLNPTGKKKAFTKFNKLTPIEHHEFDTGFELDVTGDTATTEIYDTQRDLKISIWQETGPNKYNYLQVYIPPDRSCIAIEPMTCSADAFNNGDGLITLKPNEHVQMKYGVTVK